FVRSSWTLHRRTREPLRVRKTPRQLVQINLSAAAFHRCSPRLINGGYPLAARPVRVESSGLAFQQGAKKFANVLREKLGRVRRPEMAASAHLRPVHDVVVA